MTIQLDPLAHPAGVPLVFGSTHDAPYTLDTQITSATFSTSGPVTVVVTWNTINESAVYGSISDTLYSGGQSWWDSVSAEAYDWSAGTPPNYIQTIQNYAFAHCAIYTTLCYTPIVDGTVTITLSGTPMSGFVASDHNLAIYCLVGVAPYAYEITSQSGGGGWDSLDIYEIYGVASAAGDYVIATFSGQYDAPATHSGWQIPGTTLDYDWTTAGSYLGSAYSQHYVVTDANVAEQFIIMGSKSPCGVTGNYAFATVLLYGVLNVTEAPVPSDSCSCVLQSYAVDDNGNLVYPPGRYYHHMVYDPSHDIIIIFGGRDINGNALDDTWEGNASSCLMADASAFNNGYNIPGWRQIFPAHSPPARWGGCMASNLAGGVTTLFGGTDGTNFYNDVWTWDGTDWTDVTGTITGTPPSPRAYASGINYNSNGSGDLFVVMFGMTSTSTPLNDYWVINAGAWVQLTDLNSTAVAARFDAGMAKPNKNHTLTYLSSSEAAWFHGGRTMLDDSTSAVTDGGQYYMYSFILDNANNLYITPHYPSSYRLQTGQNATFVDTPAWPVTTDVATPYYYPQYIEFECALPNDLYYVFASNYIAAYIIQVTDVEGWFTDLIDPPHSETNMYNSYNYTAQGARCVATNDKIVIMGGLVYGTDLELTRRPVIWYPESIFIGSSSRVDNGNFVYVYSFTPPRVQSWVIDPTSEVWSDQFGTTTYEFPWCYNLFVKYDPYGSWQTAGAHQTFQSTPDAAKLSMYIAAPYNPGHKVGTLGKWLGRGADGLPLTSSVDIISSAIVGMNEVLMDVLPSTIYSINLVASPSYATLFTLPVGGQGGVFFTDIIINPLIGNVYNADQNESTVISDAAGDIFADPTIIFYPESGCVDNQTFMSPYRYHTPLNAPNWDNWSTTTANDGTSKMTSVIVMTGGPTSAVKLTSPYNMLAADIKTDFTFDGSATNTVEYAGFGLDDGAGTSAYISRKYNSILQCHAFEVEVTVNSVSILHSTIDATEHYGQLRIVTANGVIWLYAIDGNSTWKLVGKTFGWPTNSTLLRPCIRSHSVADAYVTRFNSFESQVGIIFGNSPVVDKVYGTGGYTLTVPGLKTRLGSTDITIFDHSGILKTLSSYYTYLPDGSVTISSDGYLRTTLLNSKNTIGN